MLDELGNGRLTFDNGLGLELPARFNLVADKLAVLIAFRMAGLLETIPRLTGYCGEDAFDPALVNTADCHVPVLEHYGFESILGPDDDPLFTGRNQLKRGAPALLVLELEDQHQEFFGL